jgi:ribonuclease HI
MSNITERNTLEDTKSTVNTLPDNATPCKIMFRNTIGTKFQRQNKETCVSKPQSTITEVILVADGSLLKGKGTWAAIMTDKRGVELASQQCQVTHNNLSSYRVELEGCLGAIKLTNTIPGIQSCTLYCDNKAVIHRLHTIIHRQLSTGWTDYDILIQIRKELPRDFKCLHVKGHQDGKVNPELCLEDNLNILMDMRAKKAPTTTLPLSEHHLDFAVTLNNERIAESFVKEMRKILSQDRLKQFYEKKWQKDHKTIMWDLLFKAIKSKKLGRVIIKMIHNLTPTQKFMEKRGLSPDAMCFFCNKDNKTIPHILVCPYQKEYHIEICYDKTCKKLKIKSEEEKRKIHRIITTMILGPQDNETKEKFKQQLKHGWDKVIRGFLTHEWQTEIDQLSVTIKNPEDFSKIIMTLWESWENAWK